MVDDEVTNDSIDPGIRNGELVMKFTKKRTSPGEVLLSLNNQNILIHYSVMG